MTHATYDTGADTGAPFELYEFTVPGASLVWRYTNQPSVVTYAAADYEPAVISHGQVTQQAASVGATTSIECADDNPFALAMLASLSSRPVRVVIRQIHRDDPDAEATTLFIGLVTGVSFEGAKASLPCGSRYALSSKRRVPWLTYQAGCNWEWGGAGCGVNRDAYRVTAGLVAGDQTGRVLTVAAADGFADGYFSGGWVERPSTGATWFIEEHSGANLTVALPVSPLGSTSEDFYFYPGCQKNESYCLATFDNLDNYLGYPRLPSINPFSRSAYYQSGVADIPDPGDTWAMPDGYQLVLSDQTVTIDQRGSALYSGETSYRVPVAVQFLPTGYAKVTVGATVTLTGGVWLNPKNPPAGLAEQIDFYVETPGGDEWDVWASPTGWETWNNAGSTITCTGSLSITGTSATGIRTITFVIRARDTTVGLVRAACTVTVKWLADGSGPGGA